MLPAPSASSPIIWSVILRLFSREKNLERRKGMKKYAIRSLVLFSFVTLALLVAGCASSPPSRFYTLSSSVDRPADLSAGQTEIKQLFSVGPVDIADYLDRPQIVTRTSETQVSFSEFERWGGSLKTEVNRVLVENLSALLAKEGLMAVPWRSVYRGKLVAVPITIFSLDGAPGGSLSLQARWAVLGKDTKTVEVARESTFVLPVAGTDYQSIVRAMSEALGKLSSDIAPAVRSIMAKQPPESATKPTK
jgi:uncharacterized protein